MAFNSSCSSSQKSLECSPGHAASVEFPVFCSPPVFLHPLTSLEVTFSLLSLSILLLQQLLPPGPLFPSISFLLPFALVEPTALAGIRVNESW